MKNGLEPAEVSDYLNQLSNEIERLKEEKQLEKVIEREILILNLINKFINQ